MDIYELLTQPLPTEDIQHQELRQAIAQAESLGVVIARKLQSLDHSLAAAKAAYSVALSGAMEAHSGQKVAITAAKAEAATAAQLEQIQKAEADIRYYKQIQRLIENRCSVGQSFLSNMTAQVKSQINLR